MFPDSLLGSPPELATRRVPQPKEPVTTHEQPTRQESVLAPLQPASGSATHSKSIFQDSSHPLQPVSIPPIAIQTTQACAIELEEEIRVMVGKFEELVEMVEDSFLTSGVSVVKMQRSIKHIPVSLKLQLGEFFMEHASKIFRADSIGEIFNLLSYSWDYLNPGLLIFIVERFGSPKDIALMEAYSKELGIFQRRVTVGEFVHASHAVGRVPCQHFFYQEIVTIVGDEWKTKSLQDAESYKVRLAFQLQIQSFLPKIHVKPSSIAIVFSIPRWIQINFEKLVPFFQSEGVIKVCLGDSCVIYRVSIY